MPERHLKTLGLNQDADLESVTKRFRQLAMRLHPDRNENALDEKFLALCEAYRQLRRHYQRAAFTADASAGRRHEAPQREWQGTDRRRGRRGCRTQRRFHTVCHSDFKGVFVSIKA